MYGVRVQVAVSTVMEPERLLFRKLPYPGIYRCVARYGYRDRVHMGGKFVTKLLDKVCTRTRAVSMLHAGSCMCVCCMFMLNVLGTN